MKKISLLMAGLVAMLSLPSCSEDTYPRVDFDPADLEITLNEPAMNNQILVLPDDEATKKSATFDLTTSQPDYGFSAITTYAVQVSLTPDFKFDATKAIHPGDPDDKYLPQVGDYIELRNPGTTAFIQVNCNDFDRAICKLMSYTDATTGNKTALTLDYPEGFDLAMNEMYPGQNGIIEVYVRVRAYIAQDEAASSVISNVVKLKKVLPYFDLAVPGVIYLDGEFNGWNEPSPANTPDPDAAGYPQVDGKLWALTELDTEIDSKVYRASFWLKNANDKNEFRFYMIPPATGWGANGSYGADMPDFSWKSFEMEDGIATGSIVENGQGNWRLRDKGDKDIPTGWYDFVVDLENMTLKVQKVDEPTYKTTYTPAE